MDGCRPSRGAERYDLQDPLSEQRAELTARVGNPGMPSARTHWSSGERLERLSTDSTLCPRDPSSSISSRSRSRSSVKLKDKVKPEPRFPGGLRFNFHASCGYSFF